MISSIRTFVAVVLVAFAASSAAYAKGKPQQLPVDAVPLVAETAGGPKNFSIEIADDDLERSTGLMFREDMPDDRGMLFVFPQTRLLGFWMRNTPMPLDLVFVGEDGRVQAVLPGEPFSEAGISPGVPGRFVLELKRGIANRTGIAPGIRLRHPAIDAVAGD